jgi:hypothetical protein
MVNFNFPIIQNSLSAVEQSSEAQDEHDDCLQRKQTRSRSTIHGDDEDGCFPWLLNEPITYEFDHEVSNMSVSFSGSRGGEVCFIQIIIILVFAGCCELHKVNR